MQTASLPKPALLTKSWEYRRVYRHGRRLRGERFSLIVMPNGTAANRLGISVHGIKKAVRRNRIKRIIREFYRHHKTFITPGVDVVFAVRQGFAPDSPGDVATAVAAVLTGSPAADGTDQHRFAPAIAPPPRRQGVTPGTGCLLSLLEPMTSRRQPVMPFPAFPSGPPVAGAPSVPSCRPALS